MLQRPALLNMPGAILGNISGREVNGRLSMMEFSPPHITIHWTVNPVSCTFDIVSPVIAMRPSGPDTDLCILLLMVGDL
jgi:hypothetical protein